MLLDYRNVSIYRGDQLALDRLSFSLQDGEHLAILGPNGSGKSTLIKTMTRECYPYLGNGPHRLRILGQDTWSVFDLRATLGIVTNDLVNQCTGGMSSDFAEIPRRVTVRDTVLSGFFSSVGLWNNEVTPEMHERADEAIALLEIGHLAERVLSELSSGEARRSVIARALVKSPKALVLDEPTNSLDVRTTYELREIIRKIAQTGTTIILVTHHLADIIPEIGRVMLLKDGKILRDGPKEQLLTTASLTDLFGVPIEVTERRGYYSWT